MGSEFLRILEASVSDPDLASFHHRATYENVVGRDRWTVRSVNDWVTTMLRRLPIDSLAGAALDVGCGEQPFRSLVEQSGRSYVGMDVVQNTARSVDIIGTLEGAASPEEARYAVVLCTEVLEHVVDVDAAFGGLRRLVADGGLVLLTVPFIFPLHMEPHDFRRLTVHGIRQLARDHGLEVEEATRLGGAIDVLATLMTDVSILPTRRTLYARAKARALRMAKAGLVRVLDGAWLADGVALNSNCYLSNGVVLRAAIVR